MKSVDSSPTKEWGSTIHGLRLYLGATGLGLALFLTCLEATIVSTSLVTITDDLKGSNNSSWIITSYLLTYTGFLIVWSNCSTIIGVKAAVLASLFLFIVFSAACAGSQTLNQLIIFRALQGLGGAGVYSLTLYSFVRIVPYKHFDKVSSLAGGISSLGLVLGPLLGGAIANKGSWRWVFLYNVPVGVVSWMFTWFAIPSHFPNQKVPQTQGLKTRLWLGTKSFFRRVDLLGSFLTLTTCSFIIAALQEGNSEYSWNSSLVISFFVISGTFCILFALWEWFISLHEMGIIPMFPWRLIKNRIFMGVVLGFFTSGLPLFVCIINIPQRFQIVNGSSPLGAGVKLLSFSVSCPVGIIACSILSGRLEIPFCYITLAGATMQVIGIFLYSTIDPVTTLWLGQFGYLVLGGLGVGLSVAAFYMAAPLVVDHDDQAAAVGIGIQFRTLGGVLGVAASAAILNHFIESRLSAILDPMEKAALARSTQSIMTLTPDVQNHIREVYALSYNAQMKLAASFSAAQFLAIAMIWKKDNVRFSKGKPQPEKDHIQSPSSEESIE
ncbi:hypothetical protein PENSTE_c003G06388 [Penicillium steckii]|uniref:Major facilitator superfamily (MFS) profile domain-containing protein n=1 Tax=Penicillium steckii TaxID=303698 RepID=A0A1V6TQK3_9EURO|nr:hypothetical protein PENSTE_c003G06388 [Penicillium steckii]